MRSIIVGIVLTLALAAPARAEHPEYDPDPCNGSIGGMYLVHNDYISAQTPRVSQGMIVPVVDPAKGPFYLDVREVAGEYWWSEIYLYQETNGKAGLQRGGRGFPPWPFSSIEPCQESPTPDQSIF